ncbi:putative actin family protein [Lyophyllum shimeji]|uniref:Actin family protein n=1 Tax=Lyophyllum shimeji TaxID=47721 RepID=A0A9P3URJ8_LYOSH|nr:putative actin family protein [Lyophyllum shimeji]
MSGAPATPRAKSTFAPTTPATSRVSVSATIQASPHYTTTRRHSLYGVEDRVIIDPGSRVWKVGFSGEGRPRDVFLAGGKSGASLWSLRRATDPAARAEEEKVMEVNLQRCLRSVFHDSLLTDPKARKVILVEHPLLPLYIKDNMARILFENHVPSVSFASSHLLSLFAVGRITGLVLDCGHLESVALPIFAARPLYPHLKTTPLAGARLTSHLRALLLMFGTYLPPPTSLSAAVNIPAANRATRVPQEVLPDSVIEEIKTRCCFVGDVLGAPVDARETTPSVDDGSEIEVPPSDTAHSESDFSHTGRESNISSHRESSSEFSVVSNPRVLPADAPRGENHLQALATLYTRHSTATELQMRVMPPPSQQTGTGRGTLIIPGWIRERAAEVLFEGGDVDESSVAEVILDALLKVPVDLRKTLSSSILVSGGTAMLPGFIPRLHAELIRALATPPTPSRQPARPDRPPPPAFDRYAPLRPLLPYFAVLNNPSPPPPMSDRARANAGKAPAFTPATLAWVGGSLAGALKTGGVEIAREKWDEANAKHDPDQSMDVSADFEDRAAKNILPDWTRTLLPIGAPPANVPRVSTQTEVGA